ncbi:MAG: SRPBCC family protein [Campylobacterales bacterium]
MPVFNKCSIIKCNIDELFAFHTDTNNISKISPPNTKVEILELDPPLKEGDIVKLKATKWLIPQLWEVQVSTLKPPSLLVDTALKSPFKKWEHKHEFKEVEDGVQMCDIIEYELPFGILGASLSNPVYKDLKHMFEYRHTKTKEIFEK